ncbi:hypothetical protein E2986_13095 [Frieseomelitta varia]|uniref:Uncharacterized protein n=1 Tax=Frieseomelitta varia TaxID=561572 RepID=A0A833RX51_9HYME|nr:hypothetical protein E2986_13095 [Frieseomelitta varia]
MGIPLLGYYRDTVTDRCQIVFFSRVCFKYVPFSLHLGQADAQYTEITNLESQLGLTKADCRDLQNQMSLINSLFTQMLLGATSADMDLDRLTQLLQVLENFVLRRKRGCKVNNDTSTPFATMF